MEEFKTKYKVGQKFNRLTIMKLFKANGILTADCSCCCGGAKTTRVANLVKGDAMSCGCLNREIASRLGRESKTHGHCPCPPEGRKVSRTYVCWCRIKSRCLNEKAPDFDRYGGRGISLCERWLKFENFLSDMGEVPDGMSIDRINNSLGYSKENCRWATPSQQARNRRSSRLVDVDGETMTLADLADRAIVAYSTLKFRIDHGWSISDAVSIPAGTKRPIQA